MNDHAQLLAFSGKTGESYGSALYIDGSALDHGYLEI